MKTKDIVSISLFAAIICILAPLSVPLAGGVPISLSNLAVMLAAVVLGKKKGVIAVLVYILLGAIGLPVFSAYRSGLSVLFGVTGGFIIGYIPLAFITGWFSELADQKEGTMRYVYFMVGMVIATAIQYTVGTVWFIVLLESTLNAALMACVIPFIPGDLLKMVIITVLAPKLKKVVKQA